MSRFIFSFSLYLATCLMATSCSSALLSQRGTYLKAYHVGALDQAEENLESLVYKELPRAHYTDSKDASWLLLDRATTRFANGKVEAAIEDYAKALESLDYYDQDVPAEQLAQLLLQDETEAYQAADFEQLLARLYFAFALLHQGDESNAYAILRQTEEYQQAKQQLYSHVPFTKHYRLTENALSKYLFALLLQRRGDHTNAQILYHQAYELAVGMQNPFMHLPTNGQATVLVVCHNGNSPYKISTTCPASIASAIALEMILCTQHMDPAWSTMTGIPVPALRQWPCSAPLPTYAQLDGCQRQPILPLYNIEKAASFELEQKRPVIVARGVARLLTRRYAVGYLQERDPTLGAFADLAMFIVNDQTRADTRSWSTLPAFIDVAQFNADEGCHDLNIQVYHTPYQPTTYHCRLKLKVNELCIVHIFNLHPGVTKIVIPQRFVNTP